MRSVKYHFSLIIVCLLGLTMAPGCGPAVKTSDASQRLILALPAEVNNLNPILTTDAYSSAVSEMIMSGLIRVGEDLKVIPDLAEKWEYSKDGLVWTFHLRKGVTWHDGAPFTAQDVQFTFAKILDPRTNTVRRSGYVIDGQPIKFEAIDEHTFRATLPKPFAPFLLSMGMSILPKHLLEKEDINKAAFNQHPIGTGPFIFESWQQGDYIRVKANPDFWRGKPILAEIIWRIMPDYTSRLVALETGEIYATGVNPEDYARIVKLPSVNVFEFDDFFYGYVGYNLRQPLFADKTVRQALSRAVDKEKLVAAMLKGHGTAAYCPTAPLSWTYTADVPSFKYDPAGSAKLLVESGWAKGPEGIWAKPGRLLAFTLYVSKGSKIGVDAATLLQRYWKAAGIKVDIQIIDFSTLVSLLNKPEDPKKFDAVLMGWSLGLDPDSYEIWHSSQFPKGLNFIGYNNPQVDKLIEQGRTTLDQARRKKIYQELYRQIAADQPYLFIWYSRAITAVNKKVKGLSKPGPAGLFVNIEKVWIDNTGQK